MNFTQEQATETSTALARHYQRPFPRDPRDLAEAVRGIPKTELVCVAARYVSRGALSALAGFPVTLCPPRHHALDSVTRLCRDTGEGETRRKVTKTTGNYQKKSDPRVIRAIAPNPKRPGSKSYERFALYQMGETVDQALERGVTRADVRWDESRGFIVLEAPAS